MIINLKHLCGYCLLQSISTIFFFVGYFQSPQQIKRATVSRNPIFEKPDWFIPEYSRIVIISDIDNEIDTQTLDDAIKSDPTRNQKFELDFGFRLMRDDFLNTLMRGVSPLSLLQYGLVDFTQWDSIFFHINKMNKKFFVFSNNNYDDLFNVDLKYITDFDTSSITNFKQSIIKFVENEDFELLYIDKLIPHSGLKNWAVSLAHDSEIFNENKNHSTIFLVLQQPEKSTVLHDASSKGALWVLSKDAIFASDVKQQINEHFCIDSIASSISALLDLPIPMQNHGLLLPGLLYLKENEPNKYEEYDNNSQIVEAYEFLINYDQLFNHITLLEKNNPLINSLKQATIDLTNQYANLQKEPESNNATELIQKIRMQSEKIRKWLNEEISGNLLLLGMGVTFTTASLLIYLIKSKQQGSLYNELFEIRIIDKFIFGIIIFTSIFDRNNEQLIASILTIAFIMYLIKNKASTVLFIDTFLKLTTVLFYLHFPTNIISKIILFYLLIYLGIIAYCFFGGIYKAVIQSNVEKQDALVMLTGSIISCFITYLNISYLQELLWILNLIGSICFFKQFNLPVRIVLFLLVNYSAVMEYIPIGLIASVMFLLLIEHKIKQLDLNIFIDKPDKLVVQPILFMEYFIVILACQYNLPMSPVIFQKGPHIVQLYATILFLSVRMVMQESEKIFIANMTVKQGLNKWQDSIDEFACGPCDQQFNIQDPLLVLGSVNLLGQIGIFSNELFKFNTTINELGSEYFYLQDALAQIVLIMVFLSLGRIKSIQQMSSNKKNYSQDLNKEFTIAETEPKEYRDIEL